MSVANRGILNRVYSTADENIRRSFAVMETFMFSRSVTKRGSNLTPSLDEISSSSSGASMEEAAFILMHHNDESFER